MPALIIDSNTYFNAGNRFGRLVCTGKSYVKMPHGRRQIEVICDCSETAYFSYSDPIKRGIVLSCGCYNREIMTNRIVHGMARNSIEKKHPLYSTWNGIKNRCYVKSAESYPNYGARGIKMCEEWVHYFKAFYLWAISNGWEIGLTIDRKNVNGDYTPENCRFVTDAVQARNKRNNRMVTAYEETKCFTDWSRDIRCKVAYTTLYYRLVTKKWNAEKALSTPPSITPFKKIA